MSNDSCTILSVIDQKDIILNLRHEAYIENYGNTFDKNGIKWNSVDERSIHFGFFKDDKLVSCLRLTISNDTRDFTQILLIDPPTNMNGPFGFLARAATLKGSRGLQYHTCLRAAALKLCIDQNVQSVWGALPTTALRLPQLSELNYNVKNITLEQPSYLKIKNVAIVSLIGEEKICDTYKKLLNRLKLTESELQ